MHALVNEDPDSHRDDIEASNSKCQLFPANNHRHNVSERAIRTCKEHFIRMLIGIDVTIPISMWDRHIEKTNIAVNLFLQRKVNPIYLHGLTETEF